MCHRNYYKYITLIKCWHYCRSPLELWLQWDNHDVSSCWCNHDRQFIANHVLQSRNVYYSQCFHNIWSCCVTRIHPITITYFCIYNSTNSYDSFENRSDDSFGCLILPLWPTTVTQWPDLTITLFRILIVAFVVAYASVTSTLVSLQLHYYKNGKSKHFKRVFLITVNLDERKHICWRHFLWMKK